MAWLQRLFALLAGLISAVVGVVLLAAAAGWVPGAWLIRPLDFLLASWRLQLWGTGLIALGIGLGALLMGAGAKERRREPVVTETELGRVAISRRAVERLVERAAHSVDGVRSVQVDLEQTEEGLIVSLVMDVAPDVSLPTVSHDVQSGVESYLKQTSGLKAHRVNVEIRQVAEDEARKEKDKELVRE